MGRRQICFAHLLRKFIFANIDRAVWKYQGTLTPKQLLAAAQKGSTSSRASAIVGLARVGEAEAVLDLALGSSSQTLRMVATGALRLVAAKSCLAKLTSSQDPYVRDVAERALKSARRNGLRPCDAARVDGRWRVRSPHRVRFSPTACTEPSRATAIVTDPAVRLGAEGQLARRLLVRIFPRPLVPAMTGPSLFEVIDACRDQIVERFVREVEAKDLPPLGTRRSLLIDHVPMLLRDLADELAAARSVRVTYDVFDTSLAAREHGHQRWNLQYDLGALIREYGILRYSLMETAKEAGAVPTIEEFEILAKFLNVGVAEAATSYMLNRDEQLLAERENLRFLSEAGEVLSASLDYETTLNRLTKLLVPRLADWCAIRLESTELKEQIVVAHVDPGREKAIRELFAAFPASEGPTYAYPVVRRAADARIMESIDLSAAVRAAPSPEHLDLLRSLDTYSWMVVPLGVERVTLGTLVLAYAEPERRYRKTDLELVRDLARRAALAIDNARLYAFSQAERQRVEDITRAKDSFVATVSHELRTPLNAILGWTRMLRGRALAEEKRERALEIVERNALAQNQLIADLLDISRLTAGKMRLNLAQTDLASVVDIVVESMTPAAEAKRIHLTSDVEHENAVLRADGDRLQQVIWNLLTNAVKFTPKDGAIVVSLKRIGSTFELMVKDTGIGIAPDFLPHVFEFFRQSESGTTRAPGGLGIGLAIAKSLVELHGGTLEARSAGLGHGTTFVMTLPVSPVVSTSLGVPRIPAATTGPERLSFPDLPDLRVLVVDDESDARELLATVLETCGVQVHLASTATEAIERLRSGEVDLLVSDIGMPGQDGFFLIKTLRSLPDERLKRLPALALSAFARPDDRTRALAAGFNAYLTKPVELAALMRCVTELANATSRDDADEEGGPHS